MNKLTALLKLKGNTREANFLIKEQKTLFIIARIIRMFLGYPKFTIGETLKKSVIAKNSYGLFYCREGTFDLHIISDSYEFDVRTLFEEISKKSEVIVDVGANVGKYSILASKSNPKAKVYAIEPERENFEILSKNRELNKCDNLKLIKAALTDKNKKIKIYESTVKVNKGGHSSTQVSPNFEIVNGKSFDDIFSETKSIDLLKIDTEGNELEVLEGAKDFLKNKRIKNIIVEVNDERVKKTLMNYGYSLRKIQYENYLASLNH